MKLTVEQVLAGLAVDRLAEIGEAPWAKFQDWRKFSREAVQFFHRTVRRGDHRILDLGCGYGWFVRCCQVAGRDAVGLDYGDDEHLLAAEILQVPFVPHTLRAGRPLPTSVWGPFDLITMTGVVLVHDCGEWWRVSDWVALASDVLLRLRPGGRFVLTLNRGPETTPIYRDRAAWEPIGGEVRDNVITMTKAGK